MEEDEDECEAEKEDACNPLERGIWPEEEEEMVNRMKKKQAARFSEVIRDL